MTENYIGLMSGTSADSIDSVLVSLEHNTLTLLHSYAHPIPNEVQKKIWQLNAASPDELNTMLTLDHKLGILFSDAVQILLAKSSLTNKDIVAIGCHGQTVRHYPDSKYPTTLQIGDANLLVATTGITTVSDFRRADIASGGQGAPLAPAFHQIQFQHAELNRVIVNIGGIANITYIPANQYAKIIGFDTGPGNGLMDEWIQKNKNKNYDKDGAWAKTGSIDYSLLTSLQEYHYFTKAYPKSTGRDIFNLAWLESILIPYQANNEISNADVQMTLCALTAYSIVNDIDTIKPVDEVYICGGGVHNNVLMQLLTDLLIKKNISCQSTNELNINPDWIEACAFAWLARQRLLKLPGNCPSVTGAQQQCVLGALYSITE